MSAGAPDPIHIKKKMIDAGENVSSLARQVGFSRDYVSMVIHGKRVGMRVRRSLCRKLSMRMDRAFPGRRT